MEKRPDFNPRSPCGERPQSSGMDISKSPISIHALLAESDPVYVKRQNNQRVFQSTLSLRRATMSKKIEGNILKYFNPRSPCGERRPMESSFAASSSFQSTLSLRRATCSLSARGDERKFQSTLSLRRATLTAHVADGEGEISIHALLAESDPRWFPRYS